MEAVRKADEVAGDLLSRIVSGKIQVGSLLPKESELAEQYGVGRSVVREANKLLEVHRLVRPTRRRGTEVLDPMGSVTPAVLHAMLFPEPDKVDVSMLASLLEIRALLDAKGAALAAERRTRADVNELERATAAIEAAAPGTPESFEAMEQFGLVLANATKNRLFVMLWHWNRQIVRDFAPQLAAVRTLSGAQPGHRMVAEAIIAKDAELAERLVARYHEWANPQILQSLNEESHASSNKRKLTSR